LIYHVGFWEFFVFCGNDKRETYICSVAMRKKAKLEDIIKGIFLYAIIDVPSVFVLNNLGGAYLPNLVPPSPAEVISHYNLECTIYASEQQFYNATSNVETEWHNCVDAAQKKWLSENPGKVVYWPKKDYQDY
jgi:hypothetical protein